MIRDSQLQIPHDALEKLVGALHEHWQKCSLAGAEITLLTDTNLRRPLRRTIERSVPDLSVTAYSEVPADLTVDFEHIIRLEDIFPDPDSTQSSEQPDRISAGRAPVSAMHSSAVALDAA
jgi:hypothetical protein